MLARLIAHLPDGAAASRVLCAGEVLHIGRGEDCGLRLDHPSVSRAHAELRAEGEGWRLSDLRSKNGTWVDGSAVTEALLTRDCWLRLGDIHCEFEPVDAAAAADPQLQARRARATALTAGLQRATGFGDLLGGSLRAVIELAQCDRGFLLLREDDGYAVRAQHAIDPQQMTAHGFSGSAGAVDRALREARAVVVNDIGGEPSLAARASVIAGGLRALVCLPLLDGMRPFGAIYADRTTPGAAITELDLELLQAFAERAAVYMIARRTSDTLEAAVRPRWERIVAVAADAR